MRLTDSNVVITGCSSGIGFELVKLLLAEGCHVVACARNIGRLDIEDENLLKVTCDVSRKENLDELFDVALSKLGSIDLFIANAGFAYYEKLGEPDWDHFSSIFQTNVMSFMYCAEKMKKLNGKRPYNFVVTGSSMAFLSMPGYSLYSSTKAAIKGFADAYRYELNDGQHFQVVYPIATKTRFFSTAANGTPVPWPTQSAETVARKVINGIRKDKRSIFPSLTFRFMNALNRVFPFILKIYADIHDRAFQKWLARTEK